MASALSQEECTKMEISLDRNESTHNLEELAVPWGPGVGRDHPVERGVRPAEPLKP